MLNQKSELEHTDFLFICSSLRKATNNHTTILTKAMGQFHYRHHLPQVLLPTLLNLQTSHATFTSDILLCDSTKG
jgi:hypothetical protein